MNKFKVGSRTQSNGEMGSYLWILKEQFNQQLTFCNFLTLMLFQTILLMSMGTSSSLVTNSLQNSYSTEERNSCRIGTTWGWVNTFLGEPSKVQRDCNVNVKSACCACLRLLYDTHIKACVMLVFIYEHMNISRRSESHFTTIWDKLLPETH